MSEQAFINAISEGHKDEVIKWLQKIYSENEQLRHDITRHVQICAEQANEIVELRKQLDRYTRRSESGESLGDALDMAEELESLRKQLEHARTYRDISARACPLCKYEKGKSIERCSMHQTIDMLRKQLEQAEARCSSLLDNLLEATDAISEVIDDHWAIPSKQLRRDLVAAIAQATSPASPQADPTPPGASPKDR